MPVVSLSMELGALNKEIAEGLIDELGGRSLYGDVVEGISRRTCMPLERIKGVIEDRPSFFDRWLVPYQSLSVYGNAELLSIAARGKCRHPRSAGHWNRLQTVSIVRTSPSALGGVGSLVSALPFSWSNTTFFAVGANYRPQEKWLVRFGLGYDPAVSNDVTRTPRLPDQARVLVTAGGRYKLSNASALDFAYAHEFIRDASVNNTVTGVPGALVGKFNNQANVLSVQYNHTF